MKKGDKVYRAVVGYRNDVIVGEAEVVALGPRECRLKIIDGGGAFDWSSRFAADDSRLYDSRAEALRALDAECGSALDDAQRDLASVRAALAAEPTP